jgi:IclR family pca regulon transcriptional regulator
VDTGIDEVTNGRSESLGGLAKGLRIIECFNEATPSLTVSQAARAVSISPASARRCLLTMHELGYLSYDGKFFRPTPRMRRLGGAYTGTSPLPLLAEPYLRAVRDALDESASLAVLDGDQVSFVARAESQRIVTMNVRLGARLPAHASASGRVLLAAQSDEQIEALLRTVRFASTGPKALTSAEQVMDRIRQVRAEGMAVTDEELEPGIRTAAVPVRDSSGTLRAALSLAVSAARVSIDELVERHIPEMQRAASLLGQSI